MVSINKKLYVVEELKLIVIDSNGRYSTKRNGHI